MYFTWESLTLGCTEYWINIPSILLVQTHRRTDRSCDFTLRAWPRNLPSHTHSPGSASTREDRKATAGRTVYTKVFSIRAVSQPIDSGKDNKQRWEGTQSFWSLDSCFHHQYSMLRLLILTAKNAPWNSISTHSIIQTVSHIDSARSQCFGRTVRGMNHHQRCLRVQSIWDTVGVDPGHVSTISDCSKKPAHLIQGHEQLTWELADSARNIFEISYQTSIWYTTGGSQEQLLHFITLGRPLPESTELVCRETKL